MFGAIEHLISDLKLTVCETVDLDPHPENRVDVPDLFFFWTCGFCPHSDDFRQ